MQITIQEALDALQAARQLSGVKMKFAAGMAVSRLERELADIAEDAEAERQKLIDEFCDKNDDGQRAVEKGRVQFSGENAEGFASAYADLMTTEVTVATQLHATEIQKAATEKSEVEPAVWTGLGRLLGDA
jgi:hypothetical protein